MCERRFRKLSISAALLVTLLGLAACGAGSSSTPDSVGAGSGGVVAQVGSSPITKSAVNHWMSTLAGGDYYELSGHNMIPAGLVSDPPNFAACVTRLEAAVAKSPRKRSQPPGVQLLRKCRQLYQALRSQATAHLVKAQWLIELAREQGIKPSDKEVLQFYRRNFVVQYPNQAALRSYLASNRASVSDELLVLKLNLLSQKILEKFQAQGSQGLTQNPKLRQAEARWTARTDCHPGYVVEHCKQFHGQPPPTADLPSASVLMEQVAALVTGRCINLAACAKQ